MFKMFAKLALLALVPTLVSALTLHIPQEVRSQEPVTITWDSAPGDPERFTIELVNEAFNDQFAIANNIDPNQGEVTVTLPSVPARDGYTLKAVNVGDINDVYSETAPFNILEVQNSTPSSTATSSSTSGTGTTTRTTATATTTSGASTTTSRSTTSPTSTPAQTSATSTGPNPAATDLSGNGANSLKSNVGLAVAVIAAGAAAFAL